LQTETKTPLHHNTHTYIQSYTCSLGRLSTYRYNTYSICHSYAVYTHGDDLLTYIGDKSRDSLFTAMTRCDIYANTTA